MIKRCTPQRSLSSLFILMSLCALSLSTLSSHSVSFAQETPEETKRVAVLALRNKLQMSPSEVEYLTGLVRREAAKSLPMDYLVMTQENIISLLPPDKTLEECSSECEVDTGRLLGARYIITGEVLRFGSSLRLSLRLHDTQTGRLIGSEVAKGKELEELEGPTEGAIRLLLKELTSSASPQSTPQPSPELKASSGEGGLGVRGRAKEAMARIDAPAPRPTPKAEPKKTITPLKKTRHQTKKERDAQNSIFEINNSTRDQQGFQLDFNKRPNGRENSFWKSWPNSTRFEIDISFALGTVSDLDDLPSDVPSDLSVSFYEVNAQYYFIASLFSIYSQLSIIEVEIPGYGNRDHWIGGMGASVFINHTPRLFSKIGLGVYANDREEFGARSSLDLGLRLTSLLSLSAYGSFIVSRKNGYFQLLGSQLGFNF